MRSILLAEDDARLAALVKDYLEANDFRVFIEPDGNAVGGCVKEISPDIVILDIMLPGKDGLTICKEIRAVFPGAILMLTARNEDADQILGLEFGADDYVIKPTEPRVLLARIRALLRRLETSPVRDTRRHQIGALEVNESAREVRLDGSVIALSSHEFDLLSLLARHVGEVVSRDFLFKSLYNRPYDGLDRTVDVRISQLRKKLGDSLDNPQRIKTVWGRGYLFASDAW